MSLKKDYVADEKPPNPMTGDWGGKPTTFQEESSGLFSPFDSAVLGWPALLSFGGPSRLDGGPSHGWSEVNRGGRLLLAWWGSFNGTCWASFEDAVLSKLIPTNFFLLGSFSSWLDSITLINDPLLTLLHTSHYPESPPPYTLCRRWPRIPVKSLCSRPPALS